MVKAAACRMHGSSFLFTVKALPRSRKKASPPAPGLGAGQPNRYGQGGHKASLPIPAEGRHWRNTPSYTGRAVHPQKPP